MVWKVGGEEGRVGLEVFVMEEGVFLLLVCECFLFFWVGVLWLVEDGLL